MHTGFRMYDEVVLQIRKCGSWHKLAEVASGPGGNAHATLPFYPEVLPSFNTGLNIHLITIEALYGWSHVYAPAGAGTGTVCRETAYSFEEVIIDDALLCALETPLLEGRVVSTSVDEASGAMGVTNFSLDKNHRRPIQ